MIDLMILEILAKIAGTIITIVGIVAGFRESYHYTHYTIPNQLAQLVKQAHLGQAFQNLWDIKVSDEMRIALRAPLTAQQIQEMEKMKDDIEIRSVDCYVLSHKLKRDFLLGVVDVSVDIGSHSGKYHYNISNAKIQVTVRHDDNEGRFSRKWYVSSVEQI